MRKPRRVNKNGQTVSSIKRDTTKKEVLDRFADLPQKVTEFPEGDYDCRIEDVYQAETKYGRRVIVRLGGLPMDGVFQKYYNAELGIYPTCELYQFLKSMNAFTNEGDISWEALIDREVTAKLELGRNGQPYIKALSWACNLEDEEEVDVEEEDYVVDEDEDEELDFEK